MTALAPLIEKLRPRIGVATEPVRVEVERGAICRFALYTGETNPVFFDEERARRTRFGGIIAPPCFLSWFLKGIVPDKLFDFDLPLPTVLHSDDVVQLGAPIRPGDVIEAVGALTEVFERRGRKGPMLFQSGDVNLTNQHGAFVGMIRTISVLF
jgi:acyl dehydratase